MNRSLSLALGATSLVSAGMLVWPHEEFPLSSFAGEYRPPARAASQPFPSELPSETLTVAEGDPFAGSPAPSRALAPAPPAPLPPVASFEPPPRVPTLSYRYAGSMTSPEGAHIVYLASGNRELAVQAGTRLDDGFLVEAVSKTAVRFLHEPSQARLELPLPDREVAAP